MQSKICVLQVIPNLDVSGASQGCVDIANFLSDKNYIFFEIESLQYQYILEKRHSHQD